MFELGWNIATKLADLTDQLHAISSSHTQCAMHATGLNYILFLLLPFKEAQSDFEIWV